MPARLRPPQVSQIQPLRAHLRLHVSLHIEGRPSAESFRLDCGAPTSLGHQDCRRALSLRATTGGGSQQLRTHRAQWRPRKGLLFWRRQPLHARAADESHAAVATYSLKSRRSMPPCLCGSTACSLCSAVSWGKPTMSQMPCTSASSTRRSGCARSTQRVLRRRCTSRCRGQLCSTHHFV